MLRAVLRNVPNSCPPERAFSILNDCIDDGQYSAFADFKEAMVMAQYNARGCLLGKAEMAVQRGELFLAMQVLGEEFY